MRKRFLEKHGYRESMESAERPAKLDYIRRLHMRQHPKVDPTSKTRRLERPA